MAEGVPPHAAVLSSRLPPLVVQRQTLLIRSLPSLKTLDTYSGSALRAFHQATASGKNVVLLRRCRVKVPACGCARKHQLQPPRVGLKSRILRLAFGSQPSLRRKTLVLADQLVQSADANAPGGNSPLYPAQHSRLRSGRQRRPLQPTWQFESPRSVSSQ